MIKMVKLKFFKIYIKKVIILFLSKYFLADVKLIKHDSEKLIKVNFNS